MQSHAEHGVLVRGAFLPHVRGIGEQVRQVVWYGAFCEVCGDCVRESRLGQDAPERCDDGNRVDGDGCSSSCVVEAGWLCERRSDIDLAGDPKTYDASGLGVTVDDCTGCSDAIEAGGAIWADAQGFTCQDYADFGVCDAGSQPTDLVQPGGRHFSTPEYHEYVFAYDIDVRVGRPLELQLRVHAASDAHVFIGRPGRYGFEVVLGGWNNGRSVIRKHPSRQEVAHLYGPILDPMALKDFWITYDVDGNIAVGEGTNSSGPPLLTGGDMAPFMHAAESWNVNGASVLDEVHVATGWRAAGAWELRLQSASTAPSLAELAPTGGLPATSACCQCGGGRRVKKIGGSTVCIVSEAQPPAATRRMAATSFSVAYDASGALSADSPFAGAAAAGGKVFFAPYAAQGVGIFDTSSGAFEMTTLTGLTASSTAFRGVVAAEGQVIFVPFGADAVGVRNASGALSFKPVAPALTSEMISRSSLFSGGAVVGGEVIFAPFRVPAVGVYDIARGTLSRRADFTFPSGATGMFDGAVAVGGQVFFAPFDSDALGVYTASTSALELVALGDGLGGTSGKFSGAAFYGGFVVFAPRNAAAIGVFEVAERNFTLVDISASVGGSMRFSGAAAIAGKVVFAPHSASAAGLYEVATRTFSLLDVAGQLGGAGPYFLGAVAIDGGVVLAPHGAAPSRGRIGFVEMPGAKAPLPPPPVLPGLLEAPIILGRPTSDGFVLRLKLLNPSAGLLHAIVVPSAVADRVFLPLSRVWTQLRQPNCRLKGVRLEAAESVHEFRWRATGCGLAPGRSYATAFFVEGSLMHDLILVPFSVPVKPSVVARSASLVDSDPRPLYAAGVATMEGALDESTVTQYRLYWGTEDGKKIVERGNLQDAIAGVVNTFAGGGLRSGLFNECPLNDCAWSMELSRTRGGSSRYTIRHSTTQECLCYRLKQLQSESCPPELLTVDAEDVEDYTLVGEGSLVSLMKAECYKAVQWRKLGQTVAEVRASLACACSLYDWCVGYHLDPREGGSTGMEGALLADALLYGDVPWPPEFPRQCLGPSGDGFSYAREGCQTSTASGPPAKGISTIQTEGEKWYGFLSYVKEITSSMCLWKLEDRIVNGTVEARLENQFYKECMCQVPGPFEIGDDGVPRGEVGGDAASRRMIVGRYCNVPTLTVDGAIVPTAGYCEWTSRPRTPVPSAVLDLDAASDHSVVQADGEAEKLSSWAGVPAFKLVGGGPNASSLSIVAASQRVVPPRHTHAVWLDLRGLARVADPSRDADLLRHSLFKASRGGQDESCMELLQRSILDERASFCTDGSTCTGEDFVRCCSPEDVLPTTTTTFTITTTITTTTTTENPYDVVPAMCRATCGICPPTEPPDSPGPGTTRTTTTTACLDYDGQVEAWAPRIGRVLPTCASAAEFCRDDRTFTSTTVTTTTTTMTPPFCACRCGGLGLNASSPSLPGDKWAIGLQACGTEAMWDSRADLRAPADSGTGWVLLVTSGSGDAEGEGETTFYASGPEPPDVVVREARASCANYEVVDRASNETELVGCIATAVLEDIPPEDWRTCALSVNVSLNSAYSRQVMSISARGGYPERTEELKNRCLPRYFEPFECVHRAGIDHFVQGPKSTRVLRVDAKLSTIATKTMVPGLSFFLQDAMFGRYLQVRDIVGDVDRVQFRSDPTAGVENWGRRFVAEFDPDNDERFYLRDVTRAYYLQPEGGEATSDGVRLVMNRQKDTGANRARMQFTAEFEEPGLAFLRNAVSGRFLVPVGGEASTDGLEAEFMASQDLGPTRKRMQFVIDYEAVSSHANITVRVECRRTTFPGRIAPPSGAMRKVGVADRTCAGATLQAIGGSVGGDKPGAYYVGQAWAWDRDLSEDEVDSLFRATRTRYYGSHVLGVAGKRVAAPASLVRAVGEARCRLPGCTAAVTLTGLPTTMAAKCMLTVGVAITDFGNPLEVVEWISIDDMQVVTHCWPGRDNMVAERYLCADALDVSQTVLKSAFLSDGKVRVSLKISRDVDQYPLRNHHLDAEVEILCAGGVDSASLEGAEVLDARTQRMLVVSASDQGEGGQLAVPFTDRVNGFTSGPYMQDEPSATGAVIRFEPVDIEGLLWLFAVERHRKESVTVEDILAGLYGGLRDGGMDMCTPSGEVRGPRSVREYLADSAPRITGCRFETGVEYSILVYVDGRAAPFGGGTLRTVDFVGPAVYMPYPDRPQLRARAVLFEDTDDRIGFLTGTVTIMSAFSEQSIDSYELWFAKYDRVRGTAPIATIPATGAEFYYVPCSGLQWPLDTTNFLVYAVNSAGRSTLFERLDIEDSVVSFNTLPTIEALVGEPGIRVGLDLSSTGVKIDVAVVPASVQPIDLALVPGVCRGGESYPAEGLRFQPKGTTASGAPYYRARGHDGRFYYLYYDPNCDGMRDGQGYWMIDEDEPSIIAAIDLDGDSRCTNLASFKADMEGDPPWRGPPLYGFTDAARGISWKAMCGNALVDATVRLVPEGEVQALGSQEGLDFGRISRDMVCGLENIVRPNFGLSPCVLEPGQEYAVVIFVSLIKGECLCDNPCRCLGAMSTAMRPNVSSAAAGFHITRGGYVVPKDSSPPSLALSCGAGCRPTDRSFLISGAINDVGSSYPAFVLCAACLPAIASDDLAVRRPQLCIRPLDGLTHRWWRFRLIMSSPDACVVPIKSIDLYGETEVGPYGERIPMDGATPIDSENSGNAGIVFGIGEVAFGIRFRHTARTDSWFGVRFLENRSVNVLWARLHWDSPPSCGDAFVKQVAYEWSDDGVIWTRRAATSLVTSYQARDDVDISVHDNDHSAWGLGSFFHTVYMSEGTESFRIDGLYPNTQYDVMCQVEDSSGNKAKTAPLSLNTSDSSPPLVNVSLVNVSDFSIIARVSLSDEGLGYPGLSTCVAREKEGGAPQQPLPEPAEFQTSGQRCARTVAPRSTRTDGRLLYERLFSSRLGQQPGAVRLKQHAWGGAREELRTCGLRHEAFGEAGSCRAAPMSQQRLELLIQLKASQDAHIFVGNGSRGGIGYEIVFGALDNRRLLLRRGHASASYNTDLPLAAIVADRMTDSKETGQLFWEEHRNYWFSADPLSGYVRVGVGEVFGHDIAVEYRDPSPVLELVDVMIAAGVHSRSRDLPEVSQGAEAHICPNIANLLRQRPIILDSAVVPFHGTVVKANDGQKGDGNFCEYCLEHDPQHVCWQGARKPGSFSPPAFVIDMGRQVTIRAVRVVGPAPGTARLEQSQRVNIRIAETYSVIQAQHKVCVEKVNISGDHVFQCSDSSGVQGRYLSLWWDTDVMRLLPEPFGLIVCEIEAFERLEPRYELERFNRGDDLAPVLTPGVESEILLEGLKPNTSYEVFCYGEDRYGNGAVSSAFEVKTTDTVPPKLRMLGLVASDYSVGAKLYVSDPGQSYPVDVRCAATIGGRVPPEHAEFFLHRYWRLRFRNVTDPACTAVLASNLTFHAHGGTRLRGRIYSSHASTPPETVNLDLDGDTVVDVTMDADWTLPSAAVRASEAWLAIDTEAEGELESRLRRHEAAIQGDFIVIAEWAGNRSDVEFSLAGPNDTISASRRAAGGGVFAASLLQADPPIESVNFALVTPGAYKVQVRFFEDTLPLDIRFLVRSCGVTTQWSRKVLAEEVASKFIPVSTSPTALQGRAYSDATAIGDSVYFAPYDADGIGIFQPATGRFIEADLSEAGIVGDRKFSGAVACDNLLVLVPFDSEVIGVFETKLQVFSFLNISTQFPMRERFIGGARHDTVDGSGRRVMRVIFAPYAVGEVVTFNPFDGSISRIKLFDTWQFAGAATYRDQVIMAPYGNNTGVGVYDVLTGGFVTINIDSKVQSENFRFAGAISVESEVIFAPYNEEAVGVFDARTSKFDTVDISGKLTGEEKFRGGVLLDGSVVFAPSSSDHVGVFHVSSRTFYTQQLGITGEDKFAGAATMGPAIVFAPRMHTANVGTYYLAQSNLTYPISVPAGSTGCSRSPPSPFRAWLSSRPQENLPQLPETPILLQDGNLSTCIETGGIGRTHLDERAWWRMDLGKLQRIEAVWIAGRPRDPGAAVEVEVYGVNRDKETLCRRLRIGDATNMTDVPPLAVPCPPALYATHVKVVAVKPQGAALVLCEAEVFTAPVPTTTEVRLTFPVANYTKSVCGASDALLEWSDDGVSWTQLFTPKFQSSEAPQAVSISWWEYLFKLPFATSYQTNETQLVNITLLRENSTYDVFCWGMDAVGNDLSRELVELSEPWSETKLTEDTEQPIGGATRRLLGSDGEDFDFFGGGLTCSGRVRELLACEERVPTTDSQPPVFESSHMSGYEFFARATGTTAHVAYEVVARDAACDIRMSIGAIACGLRCGLLEFMAEEETLDTCRRKYCHRKNWTSAVPVAMGFPSLVAGARYRLVCEAQDLWGNIARGEFALEVPERNPSPVTTPDAADAAVTTSRGMWWVNTQPSTTTTAFDWGALFAPAPLLPEAPAEQGMPSEGSVRLPTQRPTTTPAAPPTTPASRPYTLVVGQPPPTTTTREALAPALVSGGSSGSGIGLVVGSGQASEQDFVLSLSVKDSGEELNLLQRPAAISALTASLRAHLALSPDDVLVIRSASVVDLPAGRRLETRRAVQVEFTVRTLGQAVASSLAEAVVELRTSASFADRFGSELRSRGIEMEVEVVGVEAVERREATGSASGSSGGLPSGDLSVGSYSAGKAKAPSVEEPAGGASEVLLPVAGGVAACVCLLVSGACALYYCCWAQDDSEVTTLDGRPSEKGSAALALQVGHREAAGPLSGRPGRSVVAALRQEAIAEDPPQERFLQPRGRGRLPTAARHSAQAPAVARVGPRHVSARPVTGQPIAGLAAPAPRPAWEVGGAKRAGTPESSCSTQTGGQPSRPSSGAAGAAPGGALLSSTWPAQGLRQAALSQDECEVSSVSSARTHPAPSTGHAAPPSLAGRLGETLR